MGITPVMLIIVNIILALLYAFNSPTYKAIVRDLLSKNNIYKYNSLSKTVSELISVVSPLLGMLLISTLGFKFGMLVNSISFLFSALIEMKFELVIDSVDKPMAKERTLDSMKQGFQYIYHNTGLMTVLIGSSLINFFVAGYNLAIPFTSHIAHFGKMYAFILIAESCGNIIGAAVNGILKKNYSLLQYSQLLVGVAIPIAIIPLCSGNIILILICCGISSAFMTMFNIQMFSNIQSNVAPQYLGRVFSVIFTVAILFMPVGTYVFSLLNLNTWSIFAIIGIGEFMVYLFMIFSIKIRNIR